MTKAQRRKAVSLVKKLHDVCEQLTDLSNDVSLGDYRAGSRLSRGVDAVEGAVQHLLAAGVSA
jgi:hypothetical protein